MFEQFTEESRKVMAAAVAQAKKFGHRHIETEDILLSMLREDSSRGATILKTLGVDTKKLEAVVEQIPRSTPNGSEKLPPNHRARRVIEFAIKEARAHEHEHIGSGHLLLGLVCVTDGIASIILTNLGLNAKNVRKKITISG